MLWYRGSIIEAVNLSKSNNAIFVVYIEGTDEKSIEMTKMVENPQIAARLENQNSFVAIKLASGSEAYTQFAQIYQLVPVPSLFFIGSSGTPLEVVAGPTADVGTLLSKIDNVDKSNKKKFSPASLSEASGSGSQTNVKKATVDFLSGEKNAEPTHPPATSAPPSLDSKLDPESEEMETVGEEAVCTCHLMVNPAPAIPPATPEDILPSQVHASSVSPEAAETTAADPVQLIATSSIEDKVERAKELIEKKKKEKEAEEKKLEREKEMERRAQGQGAAELKRWQQEQEMKNLKEERLREKKENDRARVRILEQIAQDRADRQARFMQPPSEPTSSASAPQISTQVDTGNTTRIQFKMADGSARTTQLSSDSTLGDLRQYVRDNIQRTGTFSLSTTYPRRTLTEEQDCLSLRVLGLSPSAALLVLLLDPTGHVVSSSVSTGTFAMLMQMFWSIFVNPVQNIINWLLGRQPAPSSGTAVSRRTSSPESDSGVKRRRIAVPGGAGTSEVRREGNTYRLKDRDSDDENNTWNGNSTQQM